MGVENQLNIISNTKVQMKKMRNLMILVPYPAQGHVTPMINLGLTIHPHGLQPVLVTPESIHSQLCKNQSDSVMMYMSVPESRPGNKHGDFFSIEKAMEDEMPLHLERIIHQLEEEDGDKVVCIVVDLLASWAIQVGIRKGIFVAGFWPAMLATYHLLNAIPDMVQSGFISQSGLPVKEGALCSLPGQSSLVSTQDLPWMIGDVDSIRARFQFWIRTLRRATSISYLLVNSFTNEAAFCLDKVPIFTRASTNVLPVGALISMVQPKVVKTHPSFWEEDTSCLHWLDKQQSSSVLYISFGSWVSPIGEAKIKSLATALEATAHPFLWVLGSSWRQGLPEGFPNRVLNRGKLVLWAPQTEVLKHRAVGCYLTHCGWNSTMEAIQFQKKLLCYPLAGDQFINCKYVVDVWKTGVRMDDLEQKELEQGLRIVTGNKEMSSRLAKLKGKFMGHEAISGAIDDVKVFISHVHYAKKTSKLNPATEH